MGPASARSDLDPKRNQWIRDRQLPRPDLEWVAILRAAYVLQRIRQGWHYMGCDMRSVGIDRLPDCGRKRHSLDLLPWILSGQWSDRKVHRERIELVQRQATCCWIGRERTASATDLATKRIHRQHSVPVLT